MLMAALRKRWRILLGMGLVGVVLVAGAAAYLLTRGGDVSNPDVEFRAEPTQTPTPGRPGGRGRRDDFRWPFYGYTRDRRRYFPASASLRPPLRKVWTFSGRFLLEFPPVLAGPRLFLLKDNGALNVLHKRTRRHLWSRKLGHLAAASPALDDKRLFTVILERRKGVKAGRVTALRQRDGKILWDRKLPSRSESSPVVADGTVYFGSENGTVYALRARDGAVRWTFKAAGAVKGGPALADGKLYVGDYAGRMYALRQRTGKVVWQTSTSGARFGLGSGRFYSTPAVAYGRVYAGNTDGYVYSFASSNGRLAWRKKTGGYVYGSPAVAHVPKGRPLVYIGSYDRRFYALDARSGAVRWSVNVGGRVSGGATVIGDIVYLSELDNRRTLGLGARTGRRVWTFGEGGYNPAVSDGRWIWIVGYSRLHAFRPLSTERREAIAARKRRKARERRAARRAAERRDARLRAGCHKRARRIHDRRGARIRSFRRCVRRERAARTRAACRRRARAAHDRRAAQRRSVRRCVRRNRR